MRLVLLGNHRVNYTSEQDYVWTLQKMGHEVISLQETEDRGEKVLEEALKSDVLFWVHTWGWNTPGLPMKYVLKRLKQAKIPSFTYHLDIILPLRRHKELRQTGFDQVDHFFTVEKDFADYLNRSQNVARGHYLPAGVIERDCFIAEPDPKFPYDIIFTGSYYYHQEWPYRTKLLEWLYATYGNKVHRWGHPGPDKPSSYTMGDNLNKIYSSAKIVVGDSMCPGFTKTHYWSNRIPETLGKGGFLIHPYIVGLDDWFEIGKELVTYEYNNFDDLKHKIDYYLANSTEREEIRKSGHERVKRDHTFTRRLEFMLSKI